VALSVAAALALLIAIAGAVLAELLTRRVRTADELSRATQLPILATVPAHDGGYGRPTLGAPRPALSWRGGDA
jgi:capsular polysaccharide biosynthesis protein